MPSSTLAPASPLSGTAGAVAANNVHGHAGSPTLGIAGLDAAEFELVPTLFVADTTNVYEVPLVSPVTLAVVAGGEPETVVEACAAPPM